MKIDEIEILAILITRLIMAHGKVWAMNEELKRTGMVDRDQARDVVKAVKKELETILERIGAWEDQA